MRGLSFSQPWLWAVFDPIANKDIENRGQAAPIDLIEQPIACHAAKSYDDDGLHRLLQLGLDPPQECVKSAITGVATIDRIVTSPKTLTPEQRRWYMGNDDGVHPGTRKPVFGHVLKDRRRLPMPIPWDGQLGFWEVPPLIAAEIAFQLNGTVVELELFRQGAEKLGDYVGGTVNDKLARFVDLNPGQHLWCVRGAFVAVCLACCQFQPKDTAKKKPPCRGILPLTIRGAGGGSVLR